MLRAAVLALALETLPAAAAEPELRLEGVWSQGGLVLGTVPAGAVVRFNGRPVRVSREGLFVFGFGRDAPEAATLEVAYADGRRERRALEVGQRRYRTQRVDGLPRNMVAPSAAELERIRREGARIAEVRRRDTDADSATGGPAVARVPAGSARDSWT